MVYSYNKILCSDGNELTIITHKNMMLNEKKEQNGKVTFHPYEVQKQATLSHPT